MPKEPLPPKDHAEEVALFRAELIGDLKHQELSRGALAEELRKRSKRRYRPPGAEATRTFSVPTLERWHYAYKAGGLEALHPKGRSDRGAAQCLSPELRELLCDIRTEHPGASVPVMLRTLQGEGRLDSEAAKDSTVRRLFRERGLTRQELRKHQSGHTRLRWAAAERNGLWHADVCHAALGGKDGAPKNLRIHALLDDATRYILGLRVLDTEREEDMLYLLVDTLRRHGAPDVLYLDNGSTYRGTTLRLCCERLGINLLHAAPYDPQARGKMERFWRTLRAQCLDYLPLGLSRAVLQQHLEAYVRAYHEYPHGGLLGRSPDAVWQDACDEPPAPRLVSEEQLRTALTVHKRRRLRGDNVLSLDGVLWQTDCGFLAGQVVTVRTSLLDPQPVLEHQGRSYPLRPVDPVHNGLTRRQALPPPPKSRGVPFDPPAVQLNQWRSTDGTDPDDNDPEVF